MENDELLQDAVGLIGDDLILEGKEKPKKQAYWLPRLVSAAACLAILVGIWQILPQNDLPVGVPTYPQVTTTATTVPALPPEQGQVNLWEREDFQAYSLVYTGVQAQNLGTSSGLKLTLLDNTMPTTTAPSQGEAMVQTTPIVLFGTGVVKVESLIAGRYVAYLTEDRVPVFYDTQEGVTVDLKQRILGQDAADPEVLIAIAVEKANAMYPGLLQSENNMTFLRACIFSYINGEQRLNPEEWPLDTGFMDKLDGFRDTALEDRPKKLHSMCWESYCAAVGDPRFPDYQPYRVKFLSVDAYSGKCIVQILDMRGNGLGIRCYDLAEDTLIEIWSDINWPTAVVRCTPGGRYQTVAWNMSVRYTEGIWDADVTERHLYDDIRMYVDEYQGETVSIVDTQEGYNTGAYGWNAASEGFLSDSGKVYYYKLLPEECSGKGFYVSSGVWHDRLTRFDQDTDVWIFTAGPLQEAYTEPTALTGNFVRLICDDTVAIMERGGQYYAYQLGVGELHEPGFVDEEKGYRGIKDKRTGEEITEKIRTWEFPVAGHERLRIFLAEGVLYKQDLFSEEPAQKIARADQYVLSSDGQFAFVYCNGSDRAECYNVVTLESCAIALDDQLCSQLQLQTGAVFQMTFNEQDNSLVLSFYLEENVAQKGEVDFFGLLAELDSGGWANPEVNKAYSITEEGMELFRKAARALAYAPDGVTSPEKYYPAQFPWKLDWKGLTAALEEFGVSIPGNAISVNGTKFVLYESETEKLSLVFGGGWGLCTQHPNGGSAFWFLYESQAYTYRFVFHKP